MDGRADEYKWAGPYMKSNQVVAVNTDSDMKYRILKEPLLEVNLGVVFDLNDNRGLDDQLSQVIKEMQADGTVKDIANKYLPNADRYLEDADEE